MNSTEGTGPFTPSAPEYILDNFEQTDRIAMLVLNRDFGETIQCSCKADSFSSSRQRKAGNDARGMG